MRICSLVPGATEVVAALGMTDHLVGISHECDFPVSVRHASVLVEPLVDSDHTPSVSIDQQVKALVSSGRRLYRLNERALTEARPDAILTQDLCHVCAVTPDQLDRALQSLPSQPHVLTLNPSTLDDVITDVERIGTVIGQPTRGRDLAESLRSRLGAIRAKSVASAIRPRILCLEWLSPLYIGGHWVPEMVELAGGHDVLGKPDSPSRETNWGELSNTEPDIVILMPCGFSVERTMSELTALIQSSSDWSHALASWPKTFVVDAASYFSRPGPRLVDGVELLAAIISGDASRRFGTNVVRELSTSSLPSSRPS